MTADSVRRETDAGVLVGDRVAGLDGGLVRFRGIRYGESTAGEGRFRAPRAVDGWTGEREALAFGAVAPQPASALVGPLASNQSEDCLFLNVWAPEGASGLPVMVWFHGGGFTTGMSSIPWYDGVRLASRGVVVVTVNYRLGPLGFLHLAGLGGEEWAGSANLGLLDQALSLDWVQRNVATFGGDPERVTIFGESAGGMSVATHLGFPASAGAFSGAIAQSGAAAHVHDAEGGERVALAVLDALQVPFDHLDALQSIPVERFAEIQSTLRIDTGFMPLPFRPTVDHSTLPRPPIDSEVEPSRSVPLLTGTTAEEMRLFLALDAVASSRPPLDEPRLVRRLARVFAERSLDVDPAVAAATYRARLGDDASPLDVFVAASTDLVFRMPAIELAEAHAGPTFMYLFTHESTAFDGMLGSAHAVEIPFVFDTLDQRGTKFLVGEVTDERRALASAMADAWVAFATTGDPSCPAVGDWPAYDSGLRSTMRLDTTHGVVEDPHRDERLLWQPDRG